VVVSFLTASREINRRHATAAPLRPLFCTSNIISIFITPTSPRFALPSPSFFFTSKLLFYYEATFSLLIAIMQQNGNIILTFSADDTQNTVLSGNGWRYDITTPTGWAIGSRTSTISRADPYNNTRYIVAEIVWGVNSNNQLRFGGGYNGQPWISDRDFMWKSGGIFSSSRAFIGAYNRGYRWKRHLNDELELFPDQKDVSGTPWVAKYWPQKHKWFKVTRDSCMELTPEALDSLDPIVVSFLILEQARRISRNTNQSDTAGATSGAIGPDPIEL
jgi:hypothetical protein